MLEIIDDLPAFGQALNGALGKEIDAYFVNVHLKSSESDYRYQMKGLDVALNLDPTKKPIILYGLMDEKQLRQNLKFQALIGKRRVGYIRAPFRPAEFRELYLGLLEDQKTEDAVALEIVRLEDINRKMGIFKHDLRHVLGRDPEEVAQICQQAREEVGLTGSDEEIVGQIIEFEPTLEGVFAGKRLPGVFCDIEGTLLIENQINQEVLKLLEDFSKEGKPITIWTGGDVKNYRDQLLQKGITWKVLSKYDFAGARVEIAIDDKSQLTIEEEYRIKAEKFIQVNPPWIS